MLRHSQFEPATTSTSPIDSSDMIPYESATSDVISLGISHELRDHLLDLYWKWQNPWQYLVHPKAFCEALQIGFYSDYLTPLMLNCVLALAARYSDRSETRTDPTDPATAGNALAEQAKALLQVELEHPTTSTVVSLAVLALREMSVNKEALGWTYIGQQLKLPSFPPQAELTIRKCRSCSTHSV